MLKLFISKANSDYRRYSNLINRRNEMLSDEYYLWGAGTMGARLIEFMKNDIEFKAVIDKNPIKHGTLFHGIPVVSFDEIRDTLPKVKIVISQNIPTKARDYLLSNGFIENKDFYIIHDFIPYFYWHKDRSLSFKSVDVAVTTLCNMNCDGCQAFIPFSVSRSDKKTEDVINDVDLIFSHIDFFMNYNICVGESLLNKNLPDICEYVHDNYYGRYHYLTIQTNGMIIPSDNDLCRYSKINAIFSISDYTKNKKSRDRLINKLNEFNISWYTNAHSDKENMWFDFGNPNHINETDPIKLCERFKKCWKPCTSVHNGFFYMCIAQGYSHISAITDTLEPGDAFDLRQPKTEASREELYNILIKKSKRGYISHCMRCNSVLTPLYKNE